MTSRALQLLEKFGFKKYRFSNTKFLIKDKSNMYILDLLRGSNLITVSECAKNKNAVHIMNINEEEVTLRLEELLNE